ncbi:MAG: OmpA family protein [Saprospiraceae bacterium]|nr:OmpA family protein [Saprospiraceae bacterium]
MQSRFFFFLFLFIYLTKGFSQGVEVEGYVFEEGNRGYLNLATITMIDKQSGQELGTLLTNKEGVFRAQLPSEREFLIVVAKNLFEPQEQVVSTVGKKDGEKIFLRFKMDRKPGYIFEVTLAEKKKKKDVEVSVDAISDVRIEVYNNTQDTQIINIPHHPEHTFNVHFEDGNHYTLLIRKKGFFNKRMEAYVNVQGCILCFEGVGEVKPSDVLSEGNSMGTLLANVELDRIYMNKGIVLENIYYEYNKYGLNPAAKFELDKLINLLKTNPSLVVELGSHTDSRGADEYNLQLSQRRAEAAANYITSNSDIERFRINGAGYGETTLTNKCSNGEECTEDQHAKNRRTELKVVGRMAVDPFENKSLKEILEIEKVDQLLAEIMSQDEVVRINPGEELPDDIKKSLGEQDSVSIQSVEPIVNAESEDIQQKVEETIVEKLEEEIVKEEPVFVDEPVVEEPVQMAEDIIEEPVETVVETIIEKESREDPEPIIDMEPESVVQKKEVSTSTSKIVKEVEVDPGRPFRRPKSLGREYSGFMIEFYTATTELPGSHKIFYRHGNIIIDQNRDGSYSYLLGKFEEEGDAKDFLDNIIRPQYDQAKLVHYKKGNRVGG